MVPHRTTKSSSIPNPPLRDVKQHLPRYPALRLASNNTILWQQSPERPQWLQCVTSITDAMLRLQEHNLLDPCRNGKSPLTRTVDLGSTILWQQSTERPEWLQRVTSIPSAMLRLQQHNLMATIIRTSKVATMCHQYPQRLREARLQIVERRLVLQSFSGMKLKPRNLIHHKAAIFFMFCSAWLLR